MKLEDECTVIITTFFAGKKLETCLNSIPKNLKKIIVDNGCEEKNKEFYERLYKNLTYVIPGRNLGIPSSYQLAWEHVKTKYIFQTQPDVIVDNNCIHELYKAAKKYPNAGVLSPLTFHDDKYSANGNFFYLKYSKNKKKIYQKIRQNKLYDRIPNGDFSVDAVSATAMFIDTDKLELLKGWDTKIFAYFEDIDLCLRFKLMNFDIIKVKNAKLNHQAFSSHSKDFHNEMDYSRNFHYSWSKIYFNSKYEGILSGKLEGFLMVLKYFFKLIFYSIFKRYKMNTYKARFLGSAASLFSREAYYRPKIK